MKRHINKAGGHKIKSPFIKYCTTATACLQIASVGMCFMLFKTNAVINVDENYNNKATTYNATSVETVINKLEQEVAAEPSINNTTSSDANIPGVTSNLSDSEVYQKLLNSEYSGKAYALACVYKAISAQYGHNAAVGIMANVNCEGNLGLVQYGHSVPGWDGANSSPTSSTNSPVKVSSAANANAVAALGADGSNSTGVGIVQWTFYTYMQPLASKYLSHCTTYSDEELAAAEIEMLLENASAHASSLTGSTPEECCKNWLIDFENPQNATSKIIERCGHATRINSILQGGT